MRTDMHKVIVECYRHGRGPEKFGRRANIPLDERPKVEGIRACHLSRTTFGENLSPLRRWLRSQTGRLWDKVYGEASQVIKPDSVVRNHIKLHLLEMVQRQTFLRAGEVWCFREGFWGGAQEIPVTRACSRYAPFYVHPRTGLLCEVKRFPRVDARWRRQARETRNRNRWLADDILLHCLAGIWYECRMTAWGTDRRRPRFDLNQKREITSSESYDRYGKPAVCLAKRQLSARELAEHGLKNEANPVMVGADVRRL